MVILAVNLISEQRRSLSLSRSLLLLLLTSSVHSKRLCIVAVCVVAVTLTCATLPTAPCPAAFVVDRNTD